jgi:hypothetical protein
MPKATGIEMVKKIHAGSIEPASDHGDRHISTGGIPVAPLA